MSVGFSNHKPKSLPLAFHPFSDVYWVCKLHNRLLFIYVFQVRGLALLASMGWKADATLQKAESHQRCRGDGPAKYKQGDGEANAVLG